MIKIFIVEDEKPLQEAYKYILENAGFQIVGIASNGKEAVTMYKSFSEKPDIILMDHRMPIQNGIEASKEILQIDKKSKIIFTTADETIQKIAFSIGAIAFKKKPFTNEMLINNIKMAVS